MILLLRARRAFLALCLALPLWLGVRLLARAQGWALPPGLALLGPLAAALAFAWPLSVRWVRVGRRLGLGGKLAGLVAALPTPESPFLAALSAQISLRPWRLFFPEALALLPTLVLSVFLALPPGPAPSPGLAPAEALPVQESPAEEAPSAGPRAAVRGPREVPQLPPGFPSAPAPYAELLAGLLGEAVPPEEVWERLSREEGLLRRLASLLAQAAGPEWAGDLRAEFAELVAELSRPDLRAALGAALEKEAGVAEARAIVTAALEGLAAAREVPAEGAAPPSAPEGTASSSGPGAEAPGPEAGARAPGDILLDSEAAERQPGRWEEEEEGLGVGAGWERGEPVRPGTPLDPPEVEEVLPVAVRPGEGPWRQGFVLGLPGEAPGAEPPGAAPLEVGEAELVLRARELPPGLRELVRRYFQILAEGGGP
ncbi:MAG: hypothetical protein N2507_03340 [Candidatus Bipolaricaulota bacterium]|nr:hypothetical protein [Candidatus Bipolaricaulota bacterium]